ncbi:zinc ribbon-containing protein [Vibrio nitrifigilis]|uniref:Zinc ribbon-containing protein n=1 Tax=Vibrio nitrifigilis TaxID=2789781 RepID=A0ABS0GBK5_9VIBR|nr:zinc ribbon-containing protein [Vibrio nitrifigilis]MBF8999792.1 zinc ribbon-containing protein [Vibrio nitrifigilis]
MPKQKQGYEALLEEVIETLKKSPDEISKILDKSEQVVSAANNLTKDELALISEYVKADLKEFSDSFEESKNGPFYLTITNSIWQGLMDITDKTKLEWLELGKELEQQGVYQVGDMIGLGVLVCEKCGHKTEYIHPTEVIPCPKCGHQSFHRQPLTP